MMLENQQGGFSGSYQGSLVFSVSSGAHAVELAFTVGTFLPASLEGISGSPGQLFRQQGKPEWVYN